MQNKFIAYAVLMGFALTAVAAEDGFYGDSPNDSAKIVEPKKGQESEQSIKQGKAKVKKDGGPAIYISGYGTASAYTAKQSSGAVHQGGGKRGIGTGIDESTLGLHVEGETDRFGGLEWGSVISLAVDNYNEGKPFKDAYMKVGKMDKWGMLYLGNVKGVEYRMANHAKNTQTAIGGAFDNSDVQKALINVASGVEHLQTELSYGASRAVKAMWLSPKVNGLQVGVSYTPNSESVAFGGIRSSYPTADASSSAVARRADPIHPKHTNMYKGLTAFGLNWEKKLKSGMKVMLGGVFMTGATRVYYPKIDGQGSSAHYNPGLINRHGVRAFTLAAGIEYKGFEAALQYLNNGKSGQAKDIRGRKGQTGYAAGIGYNWGVNKVGFGYQHISRKLGTAPRGYAAAPGDVSTGASTFSQVGFGKSRADSYGVQYQHVITEGLAALAEYAHVRSTTSAENYRLAQYHDATSAVRKNSGHGFLVGLGFYF